MVSERTLNSLTHQYFEHRKQADMAYKNGFPASSSEHAAMAYKVAVKYMKLMLLRNTDMAVADMRARKQRIER